MGKMKRKLSFDSSSKDQANKLHYKTITSMENLSNELFYEIFDYLNGIHICQAFANLNDHFQQLLHSSSLLFKISFSGSGQKDLRLNYWKQMMNTNSHQIYSIQLDKALYIDAFFTSLFMINSSFDHLESLACWEIELDKLLPMLDKLTILPRLFSLKITIYDNSVNLTEMYRLVFKLPMLKYYKFCIPELDLPISLPMATDEQLTRIETLNIDHFCNLNELVVIVSYTPRLRRLKFTDDSGGKLRNGIISPITLPYLTHLSIDSYTITFYEWEMFLCQMHSPLKVLTFITRSEDINFLDAHRWEQCICNHLPQLKEFHLKYHENIEENQTFETYTGEANQFTSSFWIERQWLFETEIDDNYIIYSVQPYKTRWYEYPQDKTINSFMKSHALNISDPPCADSDELLIKFIKRILTIAQIYHLEITFGRTSFSTLIQIMKILPELDSLKMSTFGSNQTKILSVEEQDVAHLLSYRNKMTKVCFDGTNFIMEVFVLMLFCPRLSFCPNLSYLKVNYINIINIDWCLCLRSILEEMNRERHQHLNSLCFRIPAADESIIKSLEKMINDEKLLINYTIQRILDNVYLQWKR